MLNITISEQAGRLIAALVGDFDNVASTQAKRGLEPVFDCTDCDVVIDCTELNYISSSGLRILLNIYKHIHGYDHWVILKGMSEDIKEVLGLGGFLQLFHTED
jgi:anti-sigma B factor antagonist